MSINGCELVNSAKKLAEKKGLPSDEVICMYGQLGLCIGTACKMIEQVADPNRCDTKMAQFLDLFGKSVQVGEQQTSTLVPSPLSPQ